MGNHDKRTQKLITKDGAYNYLLNKHHRLNKKFQEIISEIENLQANADLMSEKQFARLIAINTEYKNKFINLIKELSENERE